MTEGEHDIDNNGVPLQKTKLRRYMIRFLVKLYLKLE